MLVRRARSSPRKRNQQDSMTSISKINKALRQRFTKTVMKHNGIKDNDTENDVYQ